MPIYLDDLFGLAELFDFDCLSARNESASGYCIGNRVGSSPNATVAVTPVFETKEERDSFCSEHMGEFRNFVARGRVPSRFWEKRSLNRCMRLGFMLVLVLIANLLLAQNHGTKNESEPTPFATSCGANMECPSKEYGSSKLRSKRRAISSTSVRLRTFGKSAANSRPPSRASMSTPRSWVFHADCHPPAGRGLKPDDR